MGMEASYVAMTPSEYGDLEADPDKAMEYFYGISDMGAWMHRRDVEAEAGERVSLDKDWHALHFLLTGDDRMDEGLVPPPLGNVVLGGTPTPFEASYGQVRLLSPSEVREVAEALGAISLAELQSRFDPEDFTRREIYPNPRPGGWDEEQIASLWQIYPDLVSFFARAAAAGNVVLASMD